MSENPKGAGRPTLYISQYDDLARRYCLLGATDKELAEFFNVAESTINNWKIAHPSFREAVAEGKELADMDVAESFLRKARGYDHEGKHYPPDTAAAFIWLKNRRPQHWRDKQDLEVYGPGGKPLGQIDEAELAKRIAFILTQQSEAKP